MKTVGFVPIKLINQRTPGKNTKKFNDGTALITVFLRTLIKVNGFDELYVFCSNPEIKDYLVPGVIFIERPTYLDTQQATPQQIIEEFMKLVDADIYAVCHCTSPFVSAEHFKECLDATKSDKFDSSFTAERIQRLLWKANGQALNFNPENIPRTQELEPLYNEVSAIYAFKKQVFEKYRRRIGLNPHITEVAGVECVDIDYPEDFELANAIYMNIIKKES